MFGFAGAWSATGNMPIAVQNDRGQFLVDGFAPQNALVDLVKDIRDGLIEVIIVKGDQPVAVTQEQI